MTPLATARTGTRTSPKRPLLLIAGLLGAAAITGSATAIAGGIYTPPLFSHGDTVLRSAVTNGRLTVEDVNSSAFSSVVVLRVDLDAPLAKDQSFATSAEKLTATFSDGATVAADEVGYAISQDRTYGRVTVHFQHPATGNSLTVRMGDYVVIPDGGNGIVHDTPMEAVVALNNGSLSVGQAIAVPAGTTQFDTGRGWKYVIDSVVGDATAVQVAYHVEGNIEGLRQIPQLTDADGIFLPFPEDGSRGIVEAVRPAGGVAVLRFGGAARPVHAPSSVTFSSDQGGWHADSLPAAVAATDSAIVVDDRFVSVRLVSDKAVIGSGSPGNLATLTDDQGKTYPLYHGSSSLPAGVAQWDFEGPMGAGATRLTLTIPGYSEIEQGDWGASFAIR